MVSPSPVRLPLPRSPLEEESDEILERVNRLFKQAAILGVGMWMILMVLVWIYSPADSYEEPQGLERWTHLGTLVAILVTNTSRIMPLFLRHDGFRCTSSGFLITSVSVQVVSAVSNWILFYHPTPVLVDSYSGLRFHLVRWAEWSPLAFLMTCLTCNLDTPLRCRNQRIDFLFPTCLALSTLCGMLFPLCATPTMWWANLAISWTLFMAMFFIVYDRLKLFQDLEGQSTLFGSKALQWKEKLQLSRGACRLAIGCAGSWTLLAATFTFFAIVNKTVDPSSWMRHPAGMVIGTALHETISKVIYLNCVVDTYDKVFDQNSRALRRLEELRNFMSTVWASSSDVIVYSVHGGGKISARVSPAFLKLVDMKQDSSSSFLSLDGKVMSLVIEIYPELNSFYIFAMDLSKPITRRVASSALQAHKFTLGEMKGLTTTELNIATLACLIIELNEDKVSTKTFYRNDKDGNKTPLPCEAKVASFDGEIKVLVLRDISVRLQKFETEKKLVREITSRKKDADANSFTKHEVKNGLLAAIGQLDHLREVMQHASSKGHSSCSGEGTSQNDQVAKSMGDLELTLQSMLDTILDEAMARDIIHGNYQASTESFQVQDFLDLPQKEHGKPDRFSVKIKPDPFPVLSLDNQLLRYIYRNAVSNALRYGEKGGKIDIVLDFEPHGNIFSLRITNGPGPGHDELVRLTKDEMSQVFTPGQQLKANHSKCINRDHSLRKASSGNGAWIMQKCAESLGGSCSILFKPKQTDFVFSMKTIPIAPIECEEPFELPPRTWGIAIDDSKIQRKLMTKFFKFAGIDESRTIILGDGAKEIFSFVETVCSLVKDHPRDHFLLVADENLDIDIDGHKDATVSGSLGVQEILSRLELLGLDQTLLALIRSANDAVSDVALYRTRSHGVLKKEPLRRGGVLDAIKPLWTTHFTPIRSESASDRSESGSDCSDSDSDLSGAESSSFGASMSDIRESLDTIHILSSPAPAMRTRSSVKDRLHALKGDMMTLPLDDDMSETLDEIDGLMRTCDNSESFDAEFAAVQHKIVAMLDQHPRKRPKRQSCT